MPYLYHYQDNQARVTEYDDLKQQIVLVGGVQSDVSNVGNQVEAVNQQIPSLATGANLANANAKLDNQAIMIGGVSARANSIYSDTQAIKNNDIPRLATGNQANALSSAIAAVQSSVNAGRNESNGISRNTYNAQLTAIQNSANNAASQAAGANATGIAARNTSNASFATVNTKLDSIITSQNSGSGGGSSSVVIDSTIATITQNVNNQARDIIYILGAADNATYSNPFTSGQIGFTNSQVDTTILFDRLNSDSRLGTAVIDFGLGKTNRTVALTGMGLQSGTGSTYTPATGYPYATTITIEGSTNNSTWNSVYTWSSIGFTALAQWKYCSFANSTAYRYWRITVTAPLGYCNASELRFYGTVNNP